MECKEEAFDINDQFIDLNEKIACTEDLIYATLRVFKANGRIKKSLYACLDDLAQFRAALRLAACVIREEMDNIQKEAGL